jgi:hypothetical protein
MKRMALALTLAAVFGLGLTSNASAQGARDARVSVSFDTDSRGNMQGFLDTRVSIAFNSVSPGTVFRTVATGMAGTEARVDPQLQRPFSITLEDVTVRTVLDASCDSIGCRWHVDGNTLVVEALPPDPSRRRTWIRPSGAAMPAGSQFVNTPVSTVLDAIGRAVGEGCSYQIDAVNVGHLVTVDVSNQDELRAIAKVVRAAGLAPGAMYAVVIRRPGQKVMVIQAVLPKEPDAGDNR